MVILRTSKETIGNVVHHMKHALDSRLKLEQGDLILISQTKSSLDQYAKPIQYVMEYVRCYRDRNNESEKIWGKSWKVIVEGRNCKRLKRPFDIADYQVTSKNYGQGGPRVYVDDADALAIKQKGLLDCV